MLCVNCGNCYETLNINDICTECVEFNENYIKTIRSKLNK